MSAIWGCVDLSGERLPDALSSAMEAPFGEYRIDRYGSIAEGNLLMGCGLQYITAESKHERLPIHDAEAGLYFTADCVVDNRAELIGVLCPGRLDMPDGELMYLAYQRWGEDMPRHVLGAYAYAVYEAKRNRLTVGADHVFNRSIYYFRAGSRVYFSTLMEPILRAAGGSVAVNDEWIAVFLALTHLGTLANPADTPYRGLYRVEASHYMVFDEVKDTPAEYWSPRDLPPLRLSSDAEYREYFRSLLEQISRETLRTAGETGILLSSGLDSSTVASYAEPILAGYNKKLYAYTYVPVESYKFRYNQKRIVENERAGTELLCRMYPGIIPHFLDVPEQNSVSSIARILPALEVPYKSHNNLAWIDEFARIAAKDGVKLMLTGQMGNATISAGSILPCVLSGITRGKLIGAVSAANQYSKRQRYSRRRFAAEILRQLTPAAVKRARVKNYWGASYVNRDLARKIGIGDKDKRIESNIGSMESYTFERERELIFNPTAMAQVGEAETKLYLKHGMITRDITRDIRIFTYCLTVPMSCFVGADGRTRRLVRSYLSDKLPPPLLDETAPRGLQSGDWRERVLPEWDALYGELARGCALPQLVPYIDQKMISASLEKFISPPAPEERDEFIRLCAVYTIGLFLESAG